MTNPICGASGYAVPTWENTRDNASRFVIPTLHAHIFNPLASAFFDIVHAEVREDRRQDLDVFRI